MVLTPVALGHRFFTARASCMRSAPTRSGGAGPAVDGYQSEQLIRAVVVPRQRRLLHRRLRQPRHRRRNRRITRAFRPRLRLSTAQAQSGRVQQAARSCAMAPALVAQVRRFFTALASCMCLAPTRSGGVGPAVDGLRSESLIRAVVVPRLRLRQPQHPRLHLRQHQVHQVTWSYGRRKHRFVLVRGLLSTTGLPPVASESRILTPERRSFQRRSLIRPAISK